EVLVNTKILKTLNGEQISVHDYQNAIEKRGTPDQKRKMQRMRFDYTLCTILELQNLNQKWEPHKIKVLVIKNANLTEFHVGTLKNLRHLDISNNEITTLNGSGLEQLDKLHYFDFSYNQIRKLSSLDCLRFCPGLIEINAVYNPFEEDYRPKIV